MDHFFQVLKESLPSHLAGILEWDFIPWDQVKDRHEDPSSSLLKALLEAYFRLGQHYELEKLAEQRIPEDSWGCMRCGYCCTSMRPGPVKPETFHKWEKAGAPVAWFYNTRKRSNRDSLYKCWYYNGVRLRMCPFMMLNRNDSRPFCLIYHMGADLRPPVCSGYIPKHETCTNRPLPAEPWESN